MVNYKVVEIFILVALNLLQVSSLSTLLKEAPLEALSKEVEAAMDQTQALWQIQILTLIMKESERSMSQFTMITLFILWKMQEKCRLLTKIRTVDPNTTLVEIKNSKVTTTLGQTRSLKQIHKELPSLTKEILLQEARFNQSLSKRTL